MSQRPSQLSSDMHVIETVVKSIFSGTPLYIEAATGGISTSVYRIIYPNETFYLRLLPDARDSFASEVAVHTHLRQRQVKVPEVIHFEHFNESLQRSVMVTTAIKGTPVMDAQDLSEDAQQAVVIEAGRDLARINSVAVDGFGWLRGRVETEQLKACYPTYRACVPAGWDDSVRYYDPVLCCVRVNLADATCDKQRGRVRA